MDDQALGEILLRCQDPGDSAAWETLLTFAQPPVALVVLRAWGRNDADEMIQEVLIRVFLGIQRVSLVFASHGKPGLLAYLRVIALNTVRDHQRARLAQKRGGLRTQALTEEPRQLTAPDRRILLDQLRKAASAIASPRDRLIFELYYSHGLNAEGIAARTSLSTKGVESAIHRLVTHLRRRFNAT